MGTVPAGPESQEGSQQRRRDDGRPSGRRPRVRTATLLAVATIVGSILTPIAVAIIEKL
jgi:hypothetical protein